jgi:hypothetical protein
MICSGYRFSLSYALTFTWIAFFPTASGTWSLMMNRGRRAQWRGSFRFSLFRQWKTPLSLTILKGNNKRSWSVNWWLLKRFYRDTSDEWTPVLVSKLWGATARQNDDAWLPWRKNVVQPMEWLSRICRLYLVSKRGAGTSRNRKI